MVKSFLVKSFFSYLFALIFFYFCRSIINFKKNSINQKKINMKKTFLAAMALIVAFAFTFTSCEEPEKTKEELLMQKKGWEMFTATSSPAYTNIEDVTSEDLFISYFATCEKDDILFFNSGGAVVNFGKDICDWDTGKEKNLGEWRLAENDILTFYLPYFVDNDDLMVRLEAKVIVVNESTLQLRIPIADIDNNPAKSKASKRGIIVVRNADTKADPKYQFTITYKVAK